MRLLLLVLSGALASPELLACLDRAERACGQPMDKAALAAVPADTRLELCEYTAAVCRPEVVAEMSPARQQLHTCQTTVTRQCGIPATMPIWSISPRALPQAVAACRQIHQACAGSTPPESVASKLQRLQTCRRDVVKHCEVDPDPRASELGEDKLDARIASCEVYRTACTRTR
jgi:hypothetical protein